MSCRKAHFLVILEFDENLGLGKQIKIENSFKNEIIKDLQHLITSKEIAHFMVFDDDVINDKLKEESILDKIRAEIEELQKAYQEYGWAYDDAIKIIDKYKTGSEG